MGVNPIETMARRFGFDSATGIVLPEAAGTVAGEAFTKDLLEAYALNHLTSYQKTMGLSGDKNAAREAAASVVNSPSRETVFAAYDALGLPKDFPGEPAHQPYPAKRLDPLQDPFRRHRPVG